MRLFLLVRFVAVVAWLVFCPINAKARAAPTPVANHYVVLIDGSGSNVRGRDRREAFYTMLRDTLGNALFSDGFGADISPYDSDRDLLSICDFGIVDGSRVKKSAAREALNRFSFKTDFIHVRAEREPGWTAERFKALVVPKTWYQIQVVNWAVPLALLELRAANDFLVENTFVIMITDGEKYEDDYADEESQAFRFGDRTSPQWASDKTREFKRQYSRLGGVTSNRPSAWSASITSKDGQSKVFADLYYLESKSVTKWKRALDDVEHPLNFVSTWRKENGQAILDLEAKFNSDFEAVLQNGRLLSAALEFTRALNFVNAKPASNSAFKATIPATDDACEDKAVDYDYVVSVATRDPILGTVVHTKTLRGSLGELSAPFCGSSLAALLFDSKAPTAAFALIILGLATVKWAQSRRELPIAVRSRHHLAESPMQRLRNRETEPNALYSTILPFEAAEAFRIVPKSWLAQRLALPKTKLRIEVENGVSGTSADINEYLTIREEIVLPLSKSQDLVAFWKRCIDHPARVLFTLLQNEEPISKTEIIFPRSEEL